MRKEESVSSVNPEFSCVSQVFKNPLSPWLDWISFRESEKKDVRQLHVVGSITYFVGDTLLGNNRGSTSTLVYVMLSGDGDM